MSNELSLRLVGTQSKTSFLSAEILEMKKEFEKTLLELKIFRENLSDPNLHDELLDIESTFENDILDKINECYSSSKALILNLKEIQN